MAALSIRNRIEYAILGLGTIIAFGWLAYYINLTEGDKGGGFAAIITGLFGIAIGRQLIFFPPDTSLGNWWKKNIKPGYYGIPHTGGGLRIIRPNSPLHNIIFDLEGHVTGDEDYVLGKWRFHPIDSDCRYDMPRLAFWLTRLRSPKQTVGPQAEILDRNGEVVGHTTYKSR